MFNLSYLIYFFVSAVVVLFRQIGPRLDNANNFVNKLCKLDSLAKIMMW